MSLYVLAGWDFGRVGTMSMMVTENTGSLTFAVVCDEDGVQSADWTGSAVADLEVEDDDTAYCHEDLTSVLGSGQYDDFATALALGLTEGSRRYGNTRTYTVTWNRANQTYAIGVSAGTFAVSFSAIDSAQGERMRLLLGYASNLGQAATHTTTVRPYYSIVSAATALSRVTRPHARRGTVRGMVTSSGAHFAVAPAQLARYCEATVMFESTAGGSPSTAGTAVYASDTGGLAPWTWEDFFDHVSAIEPFRVDDGTHDWVMTLDPDMAHFEPERHQPDWDMWHIVLSGFHEGSL